MTQRQPVQEMNPTHGYRDIPRPRGWPLLGAVPGLRHDALSFMLDAHRAHGDIVALPLGIRPAVQITDPDLIRYVLVENSANYGRSPITDRLKLALGEGLVTADGERWSRQRRTMQPIFQRDRLDDLVPVMAGAAEDMLERWHALHISGNMIDIGSEMGRLALDVITRALFGTSGAGIAEEVMASVAVLQEYTTYLFWTLNPLAAKLPTPYHRRFLKALATIDAVIYRFIRERSPDSPTEGRNGSGTAGGFGSGSESRPIKTNMLDELLSARDPETGLGMDEKSLRDEVVTLFLAGHETTANALTWTWYLLDRHPGVREHLEDEAAIPDDHPASAQDLTVLPYTRRVAQEAMRLYPPVWSFNRLALGPDTLGGYKIPRGTIVFIPPWVLHRHPAFWERPEDFDPDRFTPARSAGRHRYAYLPFGAGPRTCIGSHLALMEMQVVLALVTRRYRLRLVSTYPASAQGLVTTRPRFPIMMRLESRI